MLLHKFQSLKLTLISCIGHEQGVIITKEYDMVSLFPMFLKVYHHLNPLSKVESSFAKKIDKDTNLDIFEMLINTCERAYFLKIDDIFKTSNGCKRHQMAFGMVEETCSQLLGF